MPRPHPPPLRRASGAVLAIAAMAIGGTAYADAPRQAAPCRLAGETASGCSKPAKTIKPTFVDTGAPGLSQGDIVVVPRRRAERGPHAGRHVQPGLHRS